MLSYLPRYWRRNFEEDDGGGASACIRACLRGSWVRGACACERRRLGEDGGDGAWRRTVASRAVPVHALAWHVRRGRGLGTSVLGVGVLASGQGLYRQD
jgi:hypothetical protein